MSANGDNPIAPEAPLATTASTGVTVAAEPLQEALKRLARGTPATLAGLLHDVESHALVSGTQVTAHCHCLKLDGNGRPRIDDLVDVIADHVLDYAIPRSEIREANEDFQRTHSTQRLMRLASEARRLFTDLEQSGEGGELLLFVLAETILRLPQLMCKMSLKTNTRMHVHGADGLHVGADATTGKLLLYWGESKIYGDVTGAVRECLGSVRPMLTEHSSGQRDLQLLQRHADLDDPSLEAALKNFLDPTTNRYNSVEFRGLCLVGFDCDTYPAGPSTMHVDELAKQIAAALPAWKGHLQKRITEEKLDAFGMHFLFVPFPSADAFRTLLRNKLGIGSTAVPSGASAASTATTSTPATANQAPSSSPLTTSAPQATRPKPRAPRSKGTPSGSA